jgi:hypothetical protein
VEFRSGAGAGRDLRGKGTGHLRRNKQLEQLHVFIVGQL